MTTDELFDLVAPIAIMHHANLCYEPEAKLALEKLEKNENDPTVIESFGKPNPERSWGDYITDNDPEGLPDIRVVYKELFDYIMEEEAPDWERYVDQYGAYGWRDANHEYVFTGDSYYDYPWFETAQLLRDRIQEHQNEYADKEDQKAD